MTRRGVGVEVAGRLALVNSTFAELFPNDILQYLRDKGRVGITPDEIQGKISIETIL